MCYQKYGTRSLTKVYAKTFPGAETSSTIKFWKIRTTENCCNYLKTGTIWSKRCRLNDKLCRPDKTAPLVWSRSTLYINNCLSENLETNTTAYLELTGIYHFLLRFPGCFDHQTYYHIKSAGMTLELIGIYHFFYWEFHIVLTIKLIII